MIAYFDFEGGILKIYEPFFIFALISSCWVTNFRELWLLKIGIGRKGLDEDRETSSSELKRYSIFMSYILKWSISKISSLI